MGVHAAAASEYGWAWYGQLFGGAAYFLGHPAIQPARVQVEISIIPPRRICRQSFTGADELYSFRTNPRSSVQVLMTLDESSYGVGDLAMRDHPIAWYHEFDGGRAWYTALGHPIESYSIPCSPGTCSVAFAGPLASLLDSGASRCGASGSRSPRPLSRLSALGEPRSHVFLQR